MADTDDANMDNRSKVTSRLEQTIDEQRTLLLQAHGVLMCLYEVLLYADGEDAANCAQATLAATSLIGEAVDRLDSVRIKPLIAELIPNSALRVEEPRVLYLR